MRFLAYVAICVICLLCFPADTPVLYGVEELIWTESLDMVELPSFKGWLLGENADPDFTPRIYKGVLTLDTTSQDRSWNYEKQPDFSSEKGYTIEVKLRVDPSTPPESQEGVCVGFDDGTYEERLYFEKDKVGFFRVDNIYHMDTTDDFHAYRVTVRDNKIRLYVDGEKVIEDSLEPRDSGISRIYFGDITQRIGSKGRAYWDHVRFYLDGAVSEDILYTADYLRYIKGRE